MSQPEAAVEVANDIFQVRLPLPFALNSVNCYLIRSSDGWTMLDTGLNYPPTHAAWDAAFAALGITSRDISQILLTHVHPDHFGMAGHFQALAADRGINLPVLLSPREAELARLLWGGEGQQAQAFDQFLAACGMPTYMLDTIVTSLDATTDMTRPNPRQLDTLHPGDHITIGKRDFTIIYAPGHSDGQLIFYDVADQLLLSGDHVLMKITPNIGLWPDTEPDPLGRFLDSLTSLQSLQVRLALPGHKALITDWHGRLTELIQHHQTRLTHTLAAIEGDATVYEASLKVFNSSTFSSHEWRFAMVETLAHLEYLRLRGQVKQSTDDKGIRHFYKV
jgi:glyoxylase-like metal-dependent hydrolase (beta-lactamase superfamily II)